MSGVDSRLIKIDARQAGADARAFEAELIAQGVGLPTPYHKKFGSWKNVPGPSILAAPQ